MKRYREIVVLIDNVEIPYIVTETEDILYKSFPKDENDQEYVNFLEHIDEYELIEDGA